ncbi:electron transfer flavoprotein subunit beta/FixA family protein [bacterium]|nr:electron transfer flavoprotein subunit beta/FixA family protein [bacterium]
MKIGVLVKQVASGESPLRIDTSGKWVVEESIDFTTNESDSYALEEALQIIERSGGAGEVVVISMCPAERTPKIIREALAKGGHRAIHIQEEAPYETDPFMVASIFAEALKDESFDLILSGLQSDDLGSGQTGVILGELLGMSTATLVMGVELQKGKLRVKRELESGWFQWVTLPFPACITIQSGLNQPRYPSLKGIMGAKKKEIKSIAKSDVKGSGTPMQEFSRMYTHKAEKRTEMIEGSTDQIVDRMIDIFKKNIKVI